MGNYWLDLDKKEKYEYHAEYGYVSSIRFFNINTVVEVKPKSLNFSYKKQSRCSAKEYISVWAPNDKDLGKFKLFDGFSLNCVEYINLISKESKQKATPVENIFFTVDLYEIYSNNQKLGFCRDGERKEINQSEVYYLMNPRLQWCNVAGGKSIIIYFDDII